VIGHRLADALAEFTPMSITIKSEIASLWLIGTIGSAAGSPAISTM
jgi:hypothetical protein